MSKDWVHLIHYQPSKRDKFFVYDPIERDVVFFEKEEDRNEYAKEIIDSCCDDEWCSEVEEICAGAVTHVTKQTNLKIKPPIEELDEDGFDENGNCWNDFDTICDYELKEIE